MYERFAHNGEPKQKSVGLSKLGEAAFRPGRDPPELIAATPHVTDVELVPPRSMVPWVASGPAAPVEDQLPEVVPDTAST